MNVTDQIKARKARAQQSRQPKTQEEAAQAVADLMKPPPPLTFSEKFDLIEQELGSQRKAELANYLFDKGVTSSQMANISAKDVLSINAEYESLKFKEKLEADIPVNQIAKLLGGS